MGKRRHRPKRWLWLGQVAKVYPEIVDNLQEILDEMHIIQDSPNRIKLESDTHFATISKDYFGKPRKEWLLTAFEKKETSKPANSRMDVESNPLGKSDDTATRQNLNVSEGKGREKVGDGQISPEEKNH